MPEVVIPEALARLIEATGRRLVDDYALLSEHLIMQNEVEEVLRFHARTGDALIEFVRRSREQGRVI